MTELEKALCEACRQGEICGPWWVKNCDDLKRSVSAVQSLVSGCDMEEYAHDDLIKEFKSKGLL